MSAGIRPKISFPMGGPLDRFTGTPVAVQGTQVDLRNASVGPGRLALRTGPATGTAVGFGTDVIGVESIRKTGALAVVIYDSGSRVVKLYVYDGVSMSLVNTLWTIPAPVAGHLPRVAMADVYDHIFIAHEEQDFSNRQTTKVYDVSSSVVGDFQLNLDRTGPAATKFRGVARHLSYLIAWGYGTQADPNRPEVLRISMPGDPLNFVPEHYFLVGARGDPIIGGRTLSGDGERAMFVVGKGDQWYRLFGYDRATFGVVPMDMVYGLRTSRAHVAVNGELYAWTNQGPRSSTGGPLADLSLPLDLNGPLPDASAAITDDLFAWYDPTEQEVVFCTGAWAYVLHLKDKQRRWSYKQLGRTLNCAALLVTATGTGSLTFVTATIGAVTTAPPTYGPGSDTPTFTVPWTLSGAVTTEQVEVWGQPEVFGRPGHVVFSAWTKLGTFAASALTGTVSIPYYLTNYTLAVRIVKAGSPGIGFTNTPDAWPSFARTTKVSAGTITTFVTTGLWERRTPTEHGQPFDYVGAGAFDPTHHPELTYFYEQSVDAGAHWTPHADGYYFQPLAGSIHQNADKLAVVRYRLTLIGPSASSSVSSATADVTLAPGPPTITLIKPDTGELLAGRHLHPVFVTPGTHGGPIVVRGRHDSNGSWSVDYTVPSGEVDVVALTDNSAGSGDLHVEAYTMIGDDVSTTVSQTGTGVG